MKLMIQIGLAIGLFTLLVGDFTAEAQEMALSTQEMTIEVQPNTIALPGGEAGKNIAKVPIKRARVRNTELRNLNKFYNAVSIERIYEVASVAAASDESAELKSKAKKKKRIKERRLLRKTSKGFFESDHLEEGSSGKITKGKKIKIRKKGELKSKKVKKSKTKSVDAAGSQGIISEERISAVNDVFIISFKDYKDSSGQIVRINIDQAVQDYMALSAVVSAVQN